MMLETSRPGVFAAGDGRRGSVKRVASAVGEGSMAIRQASAAELCVASLGRAAVVRMKPAAGQRSLCRDATHA